MKKMIAVSLFILVVALSGCSNEPSKYEVNFNPNNGSEITSEFIDLNDFTTLPKDPTKSGFIFGGWFWDEGEYTESFTIDSIVNSPLSNNMTVYAKWEAVEVSGDYQFLAFYNLQVEATNFEGTYEEWLETIRGPQGIPGLDGMQVQFRIENENGKVKKETVNYLVDAQSVTEAEARTVQYLLSRDEEAFEVKSASEAKIAEVIVAVETPEAE